jgi:hypothetical protein
LNFHHAIDENAEGTKEVLDDLIQTLEESTAQHGHVSNMVDNLNKALASVDETDNNNQQLKTTIQPSPIQSNSKPITVSLSSWYVVKLFQRYEPGSFVVPLPDLVLPLYKLDGYVGILVLLIPYHFFEENIL